jgi:putative MATE family efflux protein
MNPDWSMCRRILRIGVPALIENVGYWLSHAIVLYIVGTLGQMGIEDRPVGSQIVAIRVEAFSFLPGLAFGIAASTLAGQFLGAGDTKRARQAIGWAWLFGAGIMTLLGVTFMLFSEAWVRLITDEMPFVEVAPRLIFHAGWAQIGFGTAMVLSGALRGAGDSRTSMWITFASTYLIRVPGAWVLAVWLGWGLEGIWIALSCELVIRGALFVLRFLQGGWARVQV